MNANYSKSAFLYRQVRRGLQSGRYLPGQRVDPGKLAKEFKTSPTPVNLALYRLAGEGLLEHHSHSGLHVPLPNEMALRHLYDWMERLLLIACEYARRMQIELSVRDLKSHRYGQGFEDNVTRSGGRLQILLLVGTLASFAS